MSRLLVAMSMVPTGGHASSEAVTDETEILRPAPSEHWSFQPVQRPPVPEVRETARVRNEIDAFVLAALENRGATLPPAATPAVLVRRLHLDLTGLPPTIAEQGGGATGFEPERWIEGLWG